MKRREPVITVDEMQAAIDRAYDQAGALSANTRQRPTKSFTVAEFMAKKDLKATTARVMLNNLVAAGQWEKIKFGPGFVFREKETPNAKLDRSKRPVSL